jgi:hypothetical protein
MKKNVTNTLAYFGEQRKRFYDKDTRSEMARLMMRRFLAVLACEWRTTTQQTLKLVIIPATMRRLKMLARSLF